MGKSSLLNKAAGEERVVVNELAGTTRDPVDEQIELGGKFWRFVDTAGIRRRVHLAAGRRLLRVAAHQRRAREGGGRRRAARRHRADQRAGPAHHRPRARVRPRARARVQQVGPARRRPARRYLEREIEQDLAPRRLGAAGEHLRARPAATWRSWCRRSRLALESWDTRIPTGKFNALLAELTAEHPHPVRGGKQPRILFGTQASTRPPTFVLFTTGFLDPQLPPVHHSGACARSYGFEGSPINVNMRVREKRKR